MTAYGLPGSWVDDAACRTLGPIDGDRVFFPLDASNTGGRRIVHDPYAEARAICASCPVSVECLAYALETNQRHGMWGGRSEAERAALRRARGRR